MNTLNLKLSAVKKAAYTSVAGLLLSSQMFAGGGALAVTKGLNALSAEIGGPITYAILLVAIAAGGFMMWRNHGEVGNSMWAIVGVVVMCGFALSGTTLLAMLGGAGALI